MHNNSIRSCQKNVRPMLVPHAGKNLQAQYERWQPRAKYKMHLDPTVEDVKKLCSTCRKAAKVCVWGGHEAAGRAVT